MNVKDTLAKVEESMEVNFGNGVWHARWMYRINDLMADALPAAGFNIRPLSVLHYFHVIDVLGNELSWELDAAVRREPR